MVPRHQGLGERGHQTMMTNLLILMQEVVQAYPQEWAALVPVVEYLMFTAPQGAHGLSAHDLSCAYAVAHPADARLAPFMIPKGLPETDVAAKPFQGFRGLYGVFTRFTQDQAFKREQFENNSRAERTFEEGETVFRKLPRQARVPKHTLADHALGPYTVVSQPNRSNIILKLYKLICYLITK